jgi:bifunctional non-homologous end joining protein LigD
MANQNCITLHVWATRVPDLSHPDVCVFDLDPADDDQKRLRGVVLRLRDFLQELDLTSVVKTSGSKGFHVVVPLDGATDVRSVSRFAHVVGALMVRRDPDNLTLEFSKVDRGGRIYMDTGRNHPPATFAAPYTVRAKRGAPVSAPCSWVEVERGTVHPQSFTLRSLSTRIDQIGDLWSNLQPQSLVEPIQRLREISQ